jgi:tetratricopeptide (TPR) repeat protein
VTRFTGDGFKAVFGAPVAREDDPEQAIYAGLSILESAQKVAAELQAQWGIQGFQVRLGINTGLAALGGVTEAQDTVMGKAVNLAARLESAAPPGGLLISHDTYRHVRGVFNVQPLEAITVKGFAEPVQIYRVLEAKPRAFRVSTLGVEGVETRMVGRHAELKYLQDALFTTIEEHEGQIITIAGEAGVGKSRLLYEFDNWIEIHGPEVRFFQGRGRQETQNLPYALLRDTFAFRFQIQESDSAKSVREKVETGFGEALGTEESGQMRAHFIGQLLGIDFSASPDLKGVLNDPEQLRNRGLMYLGEYFQAVSEVMPTVVFLEDIHWADDSSLDAVNRLGRGFSQQRILVVCAARPSLFERRPYWGEGLAYHHRLELQPLSRRESHRLIDEILKLVERIPPELRQLVMRGAEGNPFYIEELVKMLIEDGIILKGDERWRVEPDRLAHIEVPATLTGVLQARLDSLPPDERQVLQQASVVGRIFWDDAVRCIYAESVPSGTQYTPRNTDDDLTSLRARELIYRREESAFAGSREYTFKHAVLRDVTYESVLKRLRNVYHGLVADWLIEHSAERLAEFAGLIAEHLHLAGRSEQALAYFKDAGEAALASYANPEAESYFRRALDLSPSEEVRADLLSGLGEALSRQGFSEDALQVWQEAIEIFHELGDGDCMADLYARSSWTMWQTGHQKKCEKLCQEALALVKDTPDSQGKARLLAEAGRIAHFGIGDIEAESEPLLQAALEMAERLQLLEIQAEARNTLAVRFLATIDRDLNEAINHLEQIVVLAEENGLLRAAARAHNNLAWYLEYTGDIASEYQHNLQTVEISSQIGDINGELLALGNLAGSYLGLGELQAVEEVLAKIEEIQGSSPESQAQYRLSSIRRPLLLYRGEWRQAMDMILNLWEDARQGGDPQRLAGQNLDLVDAILELDRFRTFGDLDRAESALAENLEIEFKVIPSLSRMILVCARKKQFDQAKGWLAKVKEHNNLLEFDGTKMLQLRAEVELAFADRRWGEAVAACQSLIEICQRTGHRWEWARRLIDLGDALVQRDEPGDQEQARQHLQQSLEMFTEMGADGYVDVVQERLHALDLSVLNI